MKYGLRSTSCYWHEKDILTKYPELLKLDISTDKDHVYINSDNLEKTLSDIYKCCDQCNFVVNMASDTIEIYDDYRE